MAFAGISLCRNYCMGWQLRPSTRKFYICKSFFCIVDCFRSRRKVQHPVLESATPDGQYWFIKSTGNVLQAGIVRYYQPGVATRSALWLRLNIPHALNTLGTLSAIAFPSAKSSLPPTSTMGKLRCLQRSTNEATGNFGVIRCADYGDCNKSKTVSEWNSVFSQHIFSLIK